jgi:hypothetical protein
MKKSLLVTLIACTLLAADVVAQEFPKMDASPMDMAYFPSRVAFRAFAKTEEEKNAKPIIRVTYSRPQKNDRVIWGDLVKYGEMWRIGANESTEIMLMQDVKLGDTDVKAGRYTMYAMPAENEWTIYLSSDLDGWGQYAFKPEASTVAQITVPTAKTESTVEAVSIVFEKVDDGAHMVVAWDDTMVRVPFVF